VRFKIVYGEVDAANVDPRGTEPCLIGEECIGLVTSGGYGHRTGKSLFFACVSPEHAVPGSTFEIELQGERRKATVLGEPAYDADNSLMKA
jgi:dimethylglycine dehydrogenase